MICTSCGKEVFGEARFCPSCAAPLAATSTQKELSSSTAQRVPPRRGKLWNLHTFDWRGTCPTCGTGHTPENARCPNDGSPLVVAFQCWRWNPFMLPMHTAHLRCSGNCGFSTSVVPCTRDATGIGSVNVEFRPRLFNIFIHNFVFALLNLVALAGIAAIAWYGAYFWRLFKADDFKRIPFDAQIYTGLLFLVVVGPWSWWIWTMSRLRWWPFRRTFNFEQTSRAAMKRQGK